MNEERSLNTLSGSSIQHRISSAFLLVSLLTPLIIQSAVAQESAAEKLGTWVALNAPTGHEHLATNV